MEDFNWGAEAIAKYIKNAKKKTPVKVYLKGDLSGIEWGILPYIGEGRWRIIFADWEDVAPLIEAYRHQFELIEIEQDRRLSALPLLDLTTVEARIEPGAIIREKVKIGKDAVIMMGAVINIGAEIGEQAMIDMNAVIGARGIIGKRVHVGAGAVIAGVLEPPSKQPVVIEDDVFIGANAVILEGVRVGRGSIIGAGAVVTKDIPSGVVAVGQPAKVIKTISQHTHIVEDLRG